MPDAIFAAPRLAEIYDLLDSPERPDLAAYLAMADEVNAHSVIDLGCGTGKRACRLAARGKEVAGIDPAVASLEVARRKASADRVRWIVGAVEHLPGLQGDRITMTGNVAQVVVPDEEWMAARLRGPRSGQRSMEGLDPRAVLPNDRSAGDRRGRDLGGAHTRRAAAGLLSPRLPQGREGDDIRVDLTLPHAIGDRRYPLPCTL